MSRRSRGPTDLSSDWLTFARSWARSRSGGAEAGASASAGSVAEPLSTSPQTGQRARQTATVPVCGLAGRGATIVFSCAGLGSAAVGDGADREAENTPYPRVRRRRAGASYDRPRAWPGASGTVVRCWVTLFWRLAPTSSGGH